MTKFIVARKEGMTAILDKTGKFVGVTVLEAKPNIVTKIKVKKKDGYNAVQLGYETRKKMKKPEKGHLKKSKMKAARLKEFRIFTETLEKYKTGDKVDLSGFKKKDKVSVQGFSRGLGFQGVIKRHGFHGGPETHGSRHHRAPGAIGQCSSPARVFKGKKMPGRMGVRKTTIKNLRVAKVDVEKNLIALKGNVPGKKGSFVAIRGE